MQRKKFDDLRIKIKKPLTHLKFLSFINLLWGNERSHKKFGPDRFSRFDVYWIQTSQINIDKSKCGLQYKPHQERDIYITHQDKGYLYNKTRHSYI